MTVPPGTPARHTWEAETYARNARFVADLAEPVVALLAPKPGERILDLGCGDGALTARIKALGVEVLGVDSAPDLLAAARARGLDVKLIDGQALDFSSEFDAVFSNAALHWMLDPDAVIAGVKRALKPGGRFVGEFGSFGNVATIRVAFRAAFAKRRMTIAEPWYFPSVAAYRDRLERAGFRVSHISLVPRPTELPTGLAGWIETFGGGMLKSLPEAERAALVAEVSELLRPVLQDERGVWVADYVRLRFAATRSA